MNSRILLSLIALLCIVIAIAGCTGAPGSTPAATTPASQPSAAGTIAAEATAALSGASLVPTETDSLGAARSVTVNIEKDYLGVVHATFQGGPGLIHVKKIEVTMNRADGEVKTSPLGIKVDDTTQLEGTKQSDRVMVYVTLDDGKTYKIYDELIAFKPRP
jgi:hypothetical protein